MKKINVMVHEAMEFGSAVMKAEVSDYTDYYKLGGFDTFDVVRVKWDGHDISIFLDDEGMLKSGNLGRKVEGYPEPLFGVFIITGGVDKNGDTLSIPDELNSPMKINKFIGEVEYVVK